MFTILKNKIYLFSLIISISTRFIHVMNLLSKSARTLGEHKKKPVSRSSRKFHSWISICERHGERLKRKLSSSEKGFFLRFATIFADSFFLSENGKEWSVLAIVSSMKRTKRVEKKALTSIMRITVEFRFAEHCFETSKSSIVVYLFSGLTKIGRLCFSVDCSNLYAD